MNSFSKKTTAFISAALVVGLIAPNVMFPWSGGELGTGEVRADAPLLQDSASQINYATVLGGAVDYGIVAKSIAQKNHMETTFATNHFSNRDDQGNANNNDVDYITSTALFLVGSLEDGDYIRWGYNTASSMYLEAPQDVYGAEDPSQANYFNPAIEPYGGLTNGNIIFDRAYGRTPLIQAVNANATSNVDRLINRIGEKPQEGTPPEDADIAWSYYLQARSAWDSGYVLNPNGWDCEYFTDQHGQALDGSGGGKLNINIDRDEFKNKVVYINLDSVLLQYLTRTSDFIIHKDPSTVVVVNINQDALPDTTSSLKLSKPLVVVDGVEYSGHTATNGGDPTGAGAVQKNFNETVIWNVMAENPVQISTMGGAMLIPNSKDVTIKEGNSSGWIVTGGDLTVRDEFHFLYSGSSRDSYGQMHFAVNKTFTSKYDVQGEVEKDSSIKVKPGDYKFYLQEYTSDDFADEHKYGTPLVKSNDSNSAVIFKSFTFHCEDYDNLTDEQKHYYIEKPTGDDPNSKTFYFRLSEDQNKKVVGIENSDGYIDIILKVDVNKYGKYTYFVNYKSVTGDGIVYRDYAPNDNNDYHLDYIKMSGVQFDLGQFYNKVTSDLTINKVAFAGGKEINNAVLKITRVSGPNTDKSNQDAGYELNIGLSDAQYSHLSKPITAHRTLSDGTVSADFAEAHPGMGPQGNYPQNNQLMFNGTNANHYENSISYRTSSNGPVTIVNLPDGDYALTEIQTPGGYEHAEEITFSIVGGKVVKCDSANGNTITMLDKKYVEININKVALGAGDEIDGAVLTLTSEDGHDLTNVEIQNCNNTSKNGSSISYTTTAGSVTNLKRLPAGNYTLTENAAPSGFAVQTTVYFTVDENGGITITNDNADEIGTVKDAGGPGNHKTLVMFDAVRVNIRKVNERNDVLNGAQLQIYNADKTAKVGDSFTVGQYSADLAVGNYVLVEEKAPDGYRKAADIAFSVNADGTVKIGDSVQNNNTITMQDLPGLKIKVSKRYYNNGNFDMVLR